MQRIRRGYCLMDTVPAIAPAVPAYPSRNQPATPPANPNPQGHMVPMDQPQHALAMLWRFTRNQSLTAPPEQLDPRLKQRLAAPRPQLQTQVPHTHKGQGAQQLQSAAQLSFVKKVVEAEGRAGRKRQDTYRSDKPLDVEQQPEEELRQEVAAVNVVDGQEMGAQSVLGRHGGPQEGAAME